MPGQPGVLRVLQSKPEVRAFYDKISKVYDLLSERSEAPMRRAALDKLAVKSGERILEIGPGTGHCLAEIGGSVGESGLPVGLDLSLGMLEQSRRMAGGRARLVCGDASQLPFRSGFADAIFMSFTLELFDTPEIPKVLAECRRVLKARGRIVVAGMSKEGGPDLMTEAFEWTHRHFPNFLDCRPIFVARALDEAGFEIADRAGLHMWVPVEIVLAVNPA
jgi:demethylmenaquinone methyltransferase/2-methoxy-6-polyprenyl-1,4-benzoquinol methylase